MQPDSSTGENNEREQAYSPLVRRLAEEFGIDLTTVPGTGPGGRVTRADVQHAAFGENDPPGSSGPMGRSFRPPEPSEAPSTDQAEPDELLSTTEQAGTDKPQTATEQAEPTEAPRPDAEQAETNQPPPAGDQVDVAREPIVEQAETGQSRPTAEQAEPDRIPPSAEEAVPDRPPPTATQVNVAGHSATIDNEPARPMTAMAAPPTFTVFGEAEAGQLLRAQERLTEDRGVGLPLVALVVRLTVAAIDLFPELNTRFDQAEIRPSDAVHLLVAGAGEEPVLLAHAERMSLIELTDRFINGAPSAGDVESEARPEATFAIDYLVDSGVRAATAVLAPPAIAAITLGRLQPVVHLVDGQSHNVPVISVTGTFDARSVGAAAGARFLAAVTSNIEDPILAFAD